jgi:hypothetical protein
MDFVEIAKAWIISVNPTPKQEEIANSRIEICNSCEHRKHLVVHYCGKCGCPLQKKIYSPAGPESCPDGRWKI